MKKKLSLIATAGLISSNEIRYWYSENDNGGIDKPDTYFGLRQC